MGVASEVIKFINYHKSDEKVGYLGVGKPQEKEKKEVRKKKATAE